MFAATVTALLLATDPGADRRHAVWLKPVSTFVSYFSEPPVRFLDKPVSWGIGGQLGFSPPFSATLETTFIPIASTSDDNTSSPAWLFTGSLGLLISVWGPEPLKGFFVHPRVAFATGRAWGPRCGFFPCSAQVELFEALGFLDVGFQWRFWRLFVAVVVGIGAGVCVGCTDGTASQTISRGKKGTPRTDRVGWELDLDVLRVGVAL